MAVQQEKEQSWVSENYHIIVKNIIPHLSNDDVKTYLWVNTITRQLAIQELTERGNQINKQIPLNISYKKAHMNLELFKQDEILLNYTYESDNCHLLETLAFGNVEIFDWVIKQYEKQENTGHIKNLLKNIEDIRILDNVIYNCIQNDYIELLKYICKHIFEKLYDKNYIRNIIKQKIMLNTTTKTNINIIKWTLKNYYEDADIKSIIYDEDNYVIEDNSIYNVLSWFISGIICKNTLNTIKEIIKIIEQHFKEDNIVKKITHHLNNINTERKNLIKDLYLRIKYIEVLHWLEDNGLKTEGLYVNMTLSKFLYEIYYYSDINSTNNNMKTIKYLLDKSNINMYEWYKNREEELQIIIDEELLKIDLLIHEFYCFKELTTILKYIIDQAAYILNKKILSGNLYNKQIISYLSNIYNISYKIIIYLIKTNLLESPYIKDKSIILQKILENLELIGGEKEYEVSNWIIKNVCENKKYKIELQNLDIQQLYLKSLYTFYPKNLQKIDEEIITYNKIKLYLDQITDYKLSRFKRIINGALTTDRMELLNHIYNEHKNNRTLTEVIIDCIKFFINRDMHMSYINVIKFINNIQYNDEAFLLDMHPRREKMYIILMVWKNILYYSVEEEIEWFYGTYREILNKKLPIINCTAIEYVNNKIIETIFTKPYLREERLPSIKELIEKDKINLKQHILNNKQKYIDILFNLRLHDCKYIMFDLLKMTAEEIREIITPNKLKNMENYPRAKAAIILNSL